MITNFMLVLIVSFIELGIICGVLIFIGLSDREEVMSKKCETCGSCLKDVWVLPNHYLYCELCMVAYRISFGGLTKVEECDTIEAIKQIYGTRIN